VTASFPITLKLFFIKHPTIDATGQYVES